MSLPDIRKDYKLKSLDEADVATGPIDQFTHWWAEAINSNIDEVNAITLCTVSPDGRPQGRIVLLKGYSEKGFVFFTNYNSHKGQDLTANPYATLVFFWKELERQVRISGTVIKTAAAESDAYFASRPLGSRIGAWASPQSQPIPNRQLLEENTAQLQSQYATSEVPRPPHWGGFIVVPDSIEFWQGRPSRLHDRILYTKKPNGWQIQRLAP